MEILLKKEYLQGTPLQKDWGYLVEICKMNQFVKHRLEKEVLIHYQMKSLADPKKINSKSSHNYIEARAIYTVLLTILDSSLRRMDIAKDLGRNYTCINYYSKVFWDWYATNKKFRFKVHSIVLNLAEMDQHKIAEKLKIK